MKIKTNVQGGGASQCCAQCLYPPGCNRPGVVEPE